MIGSLHRDANHSLHMEGFFNNLFGAGPDYFI